MRQYHSHGSVLGNLDKTPTWIDQNEFSFYVLYIKSFADENIKFPIIVSKTSLFDFVNSLKEGDFIFSTGRMIYSAVLKNIGIVVGKHGGDLMKIQK